MRIEWLEDILAVAETGSFTEAASRRHLTQSAFSRRIKAIEDSLRVELFDRSRKPVHLRPAIAEHKDRIAALVVAVRQLAGELRRGDREGADRVVIASQHSLTVSLSPSLVARLGRDGHNIHVRLRSANLDQCFALLLSGQADIALAYRLPEEEHPINADYIETAVIGTDRLIPIVSTGRAVDVRSRIAQGELDYVAYPEDVFLGQVMNRTILTQVANLDQIVVRAETALTLAAVEMASVGVAVAWVPESLARDRLRRKDVSDLCDILPSRSLDITAVRLRESSGAVVRLVWGCLMAWL
ncbi:MAG: LysR family transcriptional regulator [Pseudomonadota bacterium]